MKGRKGSVDEGGVRVPFYIKWPGKIKQGITFQLAQDLDNMPTLLDLCKVDYLHVKPLDGKNLSRIIKKEMKDFYRLIFFRQGNQVLENCNSSVRNDCYRLVLTRKDILLYDMLNDPAQKTDIFDKLSDIGNFLLSELQKHNDELISSYKPVTTIEAGFEGEKNFTLPVHDAVLSGKVRYSSIHPKSISHRELDTEW